MKDRELVEIVYEDLVHIRQSCVPGARAPNLRRLSVQLRQFFVQDLIGLCWRELGGEGQPTIKAYPVPQLGDFVPSSDRDHIAFAGGAQMTAATMGGFIKFSVPEEEQRQHTYENLMAMFEPKFFSWSDFKKAPCVVVNETSVSRHQLVSYIANKRGGAHLDKKRSADQKAFDVLDGVWAGSFRFDVSSDSNGLEAIYAQLLATGQAIVDSEDIRLLMKNAEQALGYGPTAVVGRAFAVPEPGADTNIPHTALLSAVVEYGSPEVFVSCCVPLPDVERSGLGEQLLVVAAELGVSVYDIPDSFWRLFLTDNAEPQDRGIVERIGLAVRQSGLPIIFSHWPCEEDAGSDAQVLAMISMNRMCLAAEEYMASSDHGGAAKVVAHRNELTRFFPEVISHLKEPTPQDLQDANRAHLLPARHLRGSVAFTPPRSAAELILPESLAVVIVATLVEGVDATLVESVFPGLKRVVAAARAPTTGIISTARNVAA